MWDSFLLAAILGATAMASAVGGLVILTIFQKQTAGAKRASVFREGEGATIFLFDGQALVDATPSAYRLLSGSSFDDQPWFALMERLSSRFDKLQERLANVEMLGSVTLNGHVGMDGRQVILGAEMRGGLLKITLVNPGRDAGRHTGDLLTINALDCELQDLRQASNLAPFPIWRQMVNGTIIWANAAYMEQLLQVPRDADTPEWPLRAVFDLTSVKGESKGDKPRRRGPDGKTWFDITSVAVADGAMHYAMPANAAVLAEGTLEDFKQTLANTFAELSTGLAVFDNRRKLQLFNPALARLIDLPVETLLRRPALFALLDAMRDRNMLPEPKDYKSWRHQMIDLEAASVRGDYRETWHLPNGKAFRVVGRPYPNGALAFMIDDITDQVTRDRLFRVELDLVLAVINQMNDAVIAFSSLGQLMVSNRAYDSLWGHDPLALAQKDGAISVLEAWRDLSAPSLVWTEVEAALLAGTPMPRDARTLQLLDGRQISCRGLALPGGHVGLAFTVEAASASPAAPMALTG